MTRIDMTAREWHELIKPVLPHAVTDRDYPELAVVRLEVGEAAVYAVATDRHTLAAERHPVKDAGIAAEPVVVHLDAGEAAASLKLFTYSKDADPPLTLRIDQIPVPVSAAGQPWTVRALAATLEQDGTRLVLHDRRDPSHDPLSGWRAAVTGALGRPPGGKLDGLDLHAAMLARWASAARKGERLTLYAGPKPGDPLLVTVEEHFAGLWVVPQYLDGPGKTLAGLPWRAELDGYGVPPGVDPETGEKRDDG